MVSAVSVYMAMPLCQEQSPGLCDEFLLVEVLEPEGIPFMYIGGDEARPVHGQCQP